MDIRKPGRVRGEPPPTQTVSTLHRWNVILPPESFLSSEEKPRLEDGCGKVRNSGEMLRVLQPNK